MANLNNYSKVDFTKWVYDEIQKMGKGGLIRIKAFEDTRFAPCFTLPKMRALWGFQEDDPAALDTMAVNTCCARWRYLHLSINSEEFAVWLRGLDQHHMDWINDHSKSLEADSMYMCLFQPRTNSVKVKIVTDGPRKTKVFRKVSGSENQVYEDTSFKLSRDSEVFVAVTASHLWVAGQVVGISLFATYMIVFPPALALVKDQLQL